MGERSRRKLPTGHDLIKKLEELGVSRQNSSDDNSVLQQRLIEAERHIRENRLWILALISAIASVISAIAAWVAVIYKH